MYDIDFECFPRAAAEINQKPPQTDFTPGGHLVPLRGLCDAYVSPQVPRVGAVRVYTTVVLLASCGTCS